MSKEGGKLRRSRETRFKNLVAKKSAQGLDKREESDLNPLATLLKKRPRNNSGVFGVRVPTMVALTSFRHHSAPAGFSRVLYALWCGDEAATLHSRPVHRVDRVHPCAAA